MKSKAEVKAVAEDILKIYRVHVLKGFIENEIALVAVSRLNNKEIIYGRGNNEFEAFCDLQEKILLHRTRLLDDQIKLSNCQ